MRNYFTFAGKDSRDFNLYISGHKTYDSPTRDYRFYDVPGRHGSIAEDQRSLKNVQLKYESSFIFENFERDFSNLKNYLISRSGYQRLMDSYHPDEFRLAIFKDAIEPTMDQRNEVGAFDLVFECQPQRFLLSGEEKKTFNSSGAYIINPTYFESKPLIRVYGTGTLSIGDHTVVISAADTYTDIDCDIMDCFKENQNRNQFVSMSRYEFPNLSPGKNNIDFTSGISKIEITPRWFRI